MKKKYFQGSIDLNKYVWNFGKGILIWKNEFQKLSHNVRRPIRAAWNWKYLKIQTNLCQELKILEPQLKAGWMAW